MKENYFIYQGEKYVIIFEKGKMSIFKSENNKLSLLSSSELKRIEDFLNKKYSYTYDSELLLNLVNSNPNIESKEYVIDYLDWLENLIPEEYRENFYRNIKTLITDINVDLYFKGLESEADIEENNIVGGYNVKQNYVRISADALRMIWKIAKQIDKVPENYYWKEYTSDLLHELAHMASSRYDETLGKSYCGFDTHPADNEEEKNRGLTEGFTEAIAMAGVPGTFEISSGYYIEASLINQMVQIIGNEEFYRSYFCNLGTYRIQSQFNELINDKEKASNLFRMIELNYRIGGNNDTQNVLGNIQSTLLDYLDKRLEKLVNENNTEEIRKIFNIYEQMLITPKKLETMLKDPSKYDGVGESINKFNKLKEKYIEYLMDEEDDFVR